MLNGRWRLWLARAITEASTPVAVVAVIVVVVALHSARTIPQGVLWAVISGFFASILPIGFILLQVLRRRISDHHVSVRQQRSRPLVVTIGSMTLGVCVAAFGGAPRPLVALMVSMLVGLLASLTVTLAWKISIHTATLAGALTVALIVFGAQCLPIVLAAVVVGWARVDLRDHSVAQVICGNLLGGATAAAIFPLLR